MTDESLCWPLESLCDYLVPCVWLMQLNLTCDATWAAATSNLSCGASAGVTWSHRASRRACDHAPQPFTTSRTRPLMPLRRERPNTPRFSAPRPAAASLEPAPELEPEPRPETAEANAPALAAVPLPGALGAATTPSAAEVERWGCPSACPRPCPCPCPCPWPPSGTAATTAPAAAASPFSLPDREDRPLRAADAADTTGSGKGDGLSAVMPPADPDRPKGMGCIAVTPAPAPVDVPLLPDD